jgi:flagellar biosynthesis protein FlhG
VLGDFPAKTRNGSCKFFIHDFPENLYDISGLKAGLSEPAVRGPMNHTDTITTTGQTENPGVQNAAIDHFQSDLRPFSSGELIFSGNTRDCTVTISILSNKGGVGKTHLAINLACALAKSGKKVLLIDTDLGNADISNKLAIFPEHHLMDFLQKERRMDELIVETRFGFDLICGTYGEFKLANVDHAQRTRFMKHFAKVSQGYHFAIFDLGAGIARTILDFALGAEHTLIVTTPQDLISGYACAKAAFHRFMEIEARLEEKMSDYSSRTTFSPFFVINQTASAEQGFKLFDQISKTAQDNINSEGGRFRISPEYLGSIEFNKEKVRNSEARKKPLLIHAPSLKLSQSIQHMATRFTAPRQAYDPSITYQHPLKRFFAVLSQKM